MSDIPKHAGIVDVAKYDSLATENAQLKQRVEAADAKIAQLRREAAETNAFRQGAEAYGEWQNERCDHVATLNAKIAALEYQLRAAKDRVQLFEDAKIPELIAAYKEETRLAACDGIALQDQLRAAIFALDKCRREFLSIKQSLQRGIQPHELSDQAIRCEHDTKAALDALTASVPASESPA